MKFVLQGPFIGWLPLYEVKNHESTSHSCGFCCLFFWTVTSFYNTKTCVQPPTVKQNVSYNENKIAHCKQVLVVTTFLNFDDNDFSAKKSHYATFKPSSL